MIALLLAVHPAVPVLVAGVLAGGAYAAWRFLFGGGDDGPSPIVVPPGPGPTPIPEPQPSPQPPKDKGFCERTGTHYDSDRFPDPTTVALLMVPLGYAVTPSLVTAQDRAEIKLFQKRAKVLKLPGAGSTHGEMSPCTLVSLAAARDLWDAGKWDLKKARG